MIRSKRKNKNIGCHFLLERKWPKKSPFLHAVLSLMKIFVQKRIFQTTSQCNPPLAANALPLSFTFHHSFKMAAKKANLAIPKKYFRMCELITEQGNK